MSVIGNIYIAPKFNIQLTLIQLCQLSIIHALWCAVDRRLQRQENCAFVTGEEKNGKVKVLNHPANEFCVIVRVSF